MAKSVCIAILNFNGIEFLEELIPSLRAALAVWGRECSVVILDNQSTVPVGEWAAKHCPEFEFIRAPENKYLFSYNDFIATRTEDIIILLNNDIRVDSGFIAPLIKHFAAEDVFAVGATSKDWEGKNYTTGPWYLYIRKGLYFWGARRDQQRASHTLLTVGGHMAVCRRKFLELGGFNSLFYPAYCEETQLCLQAWRRGWRSIFDPDSLVYHYDGGSFKQSSSQARIQLRSYLMLQMACLPPVEPRWLSLLWIWLRLICYSAALKPHYPVIYIKSWFEWRRLRKRYASLKMQQYELDEIVRRISEPLPCNPPTGNVAEAVTGFSDGA
jgi:GT2 family glycosyltransferase